MIGWDWQSISHGLPQKEIREKSSRSCFPSKLHRPAVWLRSVSYRQVRYHNCNSFLVFDLPIWKLLAEHYRLFHHYESGTSDGDSGGSSIMDVERLDYYTLFVCGGDTTQPDQWDYHIQGFSQRYDNANCLLNQSEIGIAAGIMQAL